MSGRVEAIFITPEHGALPQPVDSVEAIPGKGLAGNRYFDEGRPEAELTLIQAEAIEALGAEHGIELEPAASRRNVLTRGISLNEFVGKRFRVGDVECRGIELCEPCSHLESLTQPGVREGLLNRGGLNAEILTGGVLRPGDAFEEL
jgi:MOSC domain-containing protein YiiM